LSFLHIAIFLADTDGYLFVAAMLTQFLRTGKGPRGLALENNWGSSGILLPWNKKDRSTSDIFDYTRIWDRIQNDISLPEGPGGIRFINFLMTPLALCGADYIARLAGSLNSPERYFEIIMSDCHKVQQEQTEVEDEVSEQDRIEVVVEGDELLEQDAADAVPDLMDDGQEEQSTWPLVINHLGHFTQCLIATARTQIEMLAQIPSVTMRISPKNSKSGVQVWFEDAGLLQVAVNAALGKNKKFSIPPLTQILPLCQQMQTTIDLFVNIPGFENIDTDSTAADIYSSTLGYEAVMFGGRVVALKNIPDLIQLAMEVHRGKGFPEWTLWISVEYLQTEMRYLVPWYLQMKRIFTTPDTCIRLFSHKVFNELNIEHATVTDYLNMMYTLKGIDMVPSLRFFPVGCELNNVEKINQYELLQESAGLALEKYEGTWKKLTNTQSFSQNFTVAHLCKPTVQTGTNSNQIENVLGNDKYTPLAIAIRALPVGAVEMTPQAITGLLATKYSLLKSTLKGNGVAGMHPDELEVLPFLFLNLFADIIKAHYNYMSSTTLSALPASVDDENPLTANTGTSSMDDTDTNLNFDNDNSTTEILPGSTKNQHNRGKRRISETVLQNHHKTKKIIADSNIS
jgi:hypothetical protein